MVTAQRETDWTVPIRLNSIHLLRLSFYGNKWELQRPEAAEDTAERYCLSNYSLLLNT
jgi:hypothetical protein